jgi:hypothetical protein
MKEDRETRRTKDLGAPGATKPFSQPFIFLFLFSTLTNATSSEVVVVNHLL